MIPATAAQEPQDFGLECAYGGGNWHCTAPCPTSQPKPGDTCNTGPMACAYGTTSCICAQGQFFCN